jgi:hypothetical protein
MTAPVCTCASTLTREQALARLEACPALPRGERLAWACSTAITIRPGRALCWNLRYSVGYVIPCHIWGMALDHDVHAWRKYAAPLRGARDDRQKWREVAVAPRADWVGPMTPRPDVKAILARADAATPGPWRNVGIGIVERAGLPLLHREIADCSGRMSGLREHNEDIDPTLRDAAFIAAASTDVPALCAYVQSLEAENERLEKLVIIDLRLEVASAQEMEKRACAERDAALERVKALRQEYLELRERFDRDGVALMR